MSKCRVTSVCHVVAMLTVQPAILAGAIALGGVGRGANGAASPFSPAEQAWLAEEGAPHRRGVVYSLNTALGFFGMAFGALIAILPALFDLRSGGTAAIGLGPAMAYRPLFSLGGVAAIANVITGVASLLTGRLTERVGIVRPVAWARLVGLLLLALMPLMPAYWLASLCTCYGRHLTGAQWVPGRRWRWAWHVTSGEATLLA